MSYVIFTCTFHSKERKLKHEKEKVQDTVQTYESICEEKSTQAQNIIGLHQQYEMLKRKNSKIRTHCIKTCQRALRLAIARATEQATMGGNELSKDDEVRALEEQQEREAAKAELLNISNLLAQNKDQNQSESQLLLSETGASNSARSDSSDYDAMWQSSAVKFPQLTGAIRTAVLNDDRHRNSYTFGRKSKKFLLPKGVSASMTNHV
jgi:myosin heavy subunit